MQNEERNGRIVQILGPVVDVKFPEGELPEIYTALTLNAASEGTGDSKLVLEVVQHVGDRTVRAIAMDSTDGLKEELKLLIRVIRLLFRWVKKL